MRTLGGVFLALLSVGALSAQYRGNIQPFVTGGPGNAVFPGGTSANNPGLIRVAPNVVYPGGGGPHLVVPGTTPRVPRYGYTGGSSVYTYPVYVPMYDPSSYVDPSAGAAPAQSAPNVIVIYPPQAPPPPAPTETAHPSMHVYPQMDAAEPAPSADHYLFAFKDHSIYSAVAYWVDGDTLHYFTNGNTHNQASLSLLDRDLTDRLNKESGVELKLPPVKK